MAKDIYATDIEVGDIVQRIKGFDNPDWKEFNPRNESVIVSVIQDGLITVRKIAQLGADYTLPSICCVLISRDKRLNMDMTFIPPITCKPITLKGVWVDAMTNKQIIVPQQPIKKIIFLYDNGSKHHATKVKQFCASTKDITGKECIEYSNHKGAHRVYRDDLAAITFICADGYTTTQKLMDKVVVEADNARMYKRKK